MRICCKILIIIFTCIFTKNIFAQSQGELRIFEEGIISTGDYESHPGFSPSGDTLFFLKCSPDFTSWTICVSYRSNGKWSEPLVASFSGMYNDADPLFSEDGKTLYFISDRPVDKDSIKKNFNIWKIIQNNNGWSEPICLDSPVNSSKDEFYPTITKNGTIYFGSRREGGFGLCDIYRSKLVSGEYREVENLGDAINTPDNEYEPFISPDESFMIFMSERPRGSDLFISYNRNGKWTSAEKLPEPFNSMADEYSPKITWDGKYFIFSSARNLFRKPSQKQESNNDFQKRIRSAGNGLGDIYIIDAQAVEFLKK